MAQSLKGRGGFKTGQSARDRHSQPILFGRKVPVPNVMDFYLHLVQMGHKGLWWETVACPEDIEKDSEDEALFRETMKEMASDSLALLISAWMPK